MKKFLKLRNEKNRSKNLENRPHRRAQIPRLTCRATGPDFAKATSQQNARAEAKLGRARGSKEGPPMGDVPHIWEVNAHLVKFLNSVLA